MNKTRISTFLSSLILLGALSMTAEAYTISGTGMVTDATGAFAALTPVGTPISGDIEVDNAAVAFGLAGPADVTDIGIAVGGFCFTFGTGTCAGTAVPITSIDGAAMTFGGGVLTGGTLNVTAFSPTFMLSIPILVDFSAGTFSASAIGLGTVDGVLDSAVVPVPAAVWLFGSALLGLAGARRRV